MYKERIKKLRNLLKRDDFFPYLVKNLPDIKYLVGFTGSNGLLLVDKRKVVFFTDFRYKTQSEKQVKEAEVVIVEGNIYSQLFSYIKGETVYINEMDISWGESYILKKALKGVKVKRTRDIVAQLRVVKDKQELFNIKRAISITEKVFKEILNIIKPGITEKEIALEIEFRLKKYGDMEVAFPPIVASGPNSALPHAKPGNRKIKKGDLVILDFGAKYNGYCADMTRTVAIGKTSDKQKKIYSIVLHAQKRAIEEVKPDMRAIELDSVARDIIKNEGYGDKFGHSLGHGVGIEVHESPVVSPRSQWMLREGFVFTVEPGIYLPGWGGVRIEDIVYIDKKGGMDLNKAEKEVLIEL